MHLGEDLFAGYQALAWTAGGLAQLSILAAICLGVASLVWPGLWNRLTRTVKPVLWGLAFCAALYAVLLLFGGLVWVAGTLTVSLGVLLGARLAREFLPGALSMGAYAALIMLAGFFLVIDLGAPAGNAVVYAAPIGLGCTAFALGRSLREPGHHGPSPALTALGLVAAGGGLWAMFSWLAEQQSVAFSLANTLSGGIIATGLARLSAYGERSGKPALRRLCRRLAGSPVMVFAVGAIAGLYIVQVRPFITAHLGFAPLVEWAVVCLVVWLIYRSAWRHIEAQTSHQFFPIWQGYMPEMERVLDQEFTYLSRIQQAFVDEGCKTDLVVYLAGLLNRMNASQDRAGKLLQPLIEYEDVRPWHILSWDRAGLAKKNSEARRRILGGVIASLKDAAQEEETVGERRARRRQRFESRFGPG